MTISIAIIDNEMNTGLLKRMLSFQDDFSVSAMAYSIEEGFNLIKEHQPDVLLFSNHLAGQNWGQVCKSITTNFPNVAVVVMTSHGSNDDINQARLAGARDFLMSPYEVDGFIASIRRAGKD